MPRPTSTADLSEYERQGDQLASFELSQFGTNPAALEAYAAFIRAVTKDGGVVEAKHGTSTVRRPKTEADLAEALASKQRTFDSTRKRYNAVSEAVDTDTVQDLDPKWRDIEAYTLRAHAEAENRPLFGLISKDDGTRLAARQALGIE